MAYIRTTEVIESGRASVDEKGIIHGERIFRVEYDSISGGDVDAIAHTTVRRGDPFVDPTGIVVPRCVCLGVASVSEDPSNSSFRLVTYTYSSEPWDKQQRGLSSGGQGNAGQPPGGGQPSPDQANVINPLARAWTIRYDRGTDEKQVLDYDMDGKAVVNSAGDAYGYETSHKITVITVEHNVQIPDSITANVWSSLADTVNSGLFLGYDRGLVRCDGVTWTSEVEDPFIFAKQVAVFSAKNPPDWTNMLISPRGDRPLDDSDTWQIILLDQGLTRLNSDGKRTPILDAVTGHPPAKPWPLDGTGKVLSDDDVAARHYYFNRYRRYDYVNYELILGFS